MLDELEEIMTAVIPETGGGRAVCAPTPTGMTPLFTRHMCGVIEVERDRRRRRRRRDGDSTFRYQSRAGTRRRRPLAAVNGNGRVVLQASADIDRWTDEGGSYDAETVARLRATATRG
jgi:hypothetical protein